MSLQRLHLRDLDSAVTIRKRALVFGDFGSPVTVGVVWDGGSAGAVFGILGKVHHKTATKTSRSGGRFTRNFR